MPTYAFDVMSAGQAAAFLPSDNLVLPGGTAPGAILVTFQGASVSLQSGARFLTFGAAFTSQTRLLNRAGEPGLIIGSTGGDVITGLSVNASVPNAPGDVIFANTGDDTIDGQAGVDTISGGSGADVINFARGVSFNDVIVDFESVDRIGLMDAPLLTATYLETTSTSMTALSSFATAEINSGRSDLVVAALGPDLFVYADSARANNVGNIVILRNVSLDQIGPSNFVAYAAPTQPPPTAPSAADAPPPPAGTPDPTPPLPPSPGPTTPHGGGGLSLAFSTITLDQALTYNAAIDTLRFDGVSSTGLFVQLGSGFTVVYQGNRSVIFGSGFTGQIGAAFSDNSRLYVGGAGADAVSMGFGPDAIYGGGGSDTLGGGDGSDRIDAGEGDDLVRGRKDDTGAFTDVLDGGAGFDTLSYATSSPDIRVLLQTRGTDTVRGFEVIEGSTGNDLIEGDDSDNIFRGGEGADLLNGLGGADLLEGGVGADGLSGGDGADTLVGGAGSDILRGGGGPDLFVFRGNDETDQIADWTSDDKLAFSVGGVPIVDGYIEIPAGQLVDTGELARSGVKVVALADAGGVNVISLGNGDVALLLGRTLADVSEANIVRADSGSTPVAPYIPIVPSGVGGSFSTVGGDGPDVLRGAGSGAETFSGGAGPDIILANAGNDSVDGGEGNDQLYGEDGKDSLFGGLGNDILVGGSGTSMLRGGEGDDLLGGGDEFDDMHGNVGNDTLRGGGFDDWVVGGQGNDLLFGEDGTDLCYGQLGSDTIDGGAGADAVVGGQANDFLFGGAGDDFITGDRGDDTLTGGPGADTFHTNNVTGLDRVSDFSFAEGDRVLVDAGSPYTLRQMGLDTVIDMSGGNQMVLVGVTLANLPSGWITGG